MKLGTLLPKRSAAFLQSLAPPTEAQRRGTQSAPITPTQQTGKPKFE
uniref:Single-stranded DNA-binding protein n=1 Tax=Bursaphelenchus xylophilus TaxID=6326 RepID=A0A1I7SGN0_BURXY